jgi:hypothetical protein
MTKTTKVMKAGAATLAASFLLAGCANDYYSQPYTPTYAPAPSYKPASLPIVWWVVDHQAMKCSPLSETGYDDPVSLRAFFARGALVGPMQHVTDGAVGFHYQLPGHSQAWMLMYADVAHCMTALGNIESNSSDGSQD